MMEGVYFSRSELISKNYLWNYYSSDDSRVSGLIDDTEFSRSEGYEVLYLINTLIEEWGLEGKESGQKLERMILNHLPFNITTQIDVKTWLKLNWKFY